MDTRHPPEPSPDPEERLLVGYLRADTPERAAPLRAALCAHATALGLAS